MQRPCFKRRNEHAECARRFRLWTADLFFFPDFSELSDITFDLCWIPEHLLGDGGTVSVHPELAGLAEGFEPLRLSLQRGTPPRRVDSTGLSCTPAPADSVGVAWRPVFRVRYTYAWTHYEAFMAAGRAAIAVSIRRPYVYL
jgi:hypothetical protein